MKQIVDGCNVIKIISWNVKYQNSYNYNSRVESVFILEASENDWIMYCFYHLIGETNTFSSLGRLHCMLALQKERKVLHETKPTTKDYQVSLFSLFISFVLVIFRLQEPSQICPVWSILSTHAPHQQTLQPSILLPPPQLAQILWHVTPRTVTGACKSNTPPTHVAIWFWFWLS